MLLTLKFEINLNLQTVRVKGSSIPQAQIKHVFPLQAEQPAAEAGHSPALPAPPPDRQRPVGKYEPAASLLHPKLS